MFKKRFLSLSLAGAVLAAFTGCATEPAEETGTEETAAAPVLAVTTDSADAEASYRAGLEATDMGRFVEAHDHMLAAVAADEDFAMGHLGAALSANSFQSFASHLKMATERSGGASEAEQAWIASVDRGFARDFEGQLVEAERLAALAPDVPRARIQVAAAQAALGRFEEERAMATAITEMAPTFVPAYVQLGNSYLFNDPRDFDKAEAAMNKVVELAPDEPNSYDLVGDVHRAQGDLEAARAAYTRAAELDPTAGAALQQRGHVNSFLGSWDEARADYQAAMDLSDPTTAASFGIWKALVSAHAGEPEAAVAELEQLIEDANSTGIEDPVGLEVNALFNVWMIAMHNEMLDEAASAIERSRELMAMQSDEVGTEEFRRGQEAQLVYYEGMLAARSGQTEPANEKAEEYMALVAADADPNKNRPAHEVMGLAALMAGDFDAAVGHYEQTDPANIYARYHFGLALEGAGETEAAQAIFDDVAKYNFNFVGYALIREDTLAKASAS